MPTVAVVEVVDLVQAADPTPPASAPCGPAPVMELTAAEMLVQLHPPTVAEQYDPYVLAQVAGAYAMYRAPRTRADA